MSVLDLARAAAGTSWESTPATVRDRVVDLVADCVAVSALGSARPELRQLVRAYDRWTPQGEASVLGSRRGWPATTAAFLNACAVAADQLQDGHRLARGHPASHVVPAVLAVAEERDLPGGEVLSAVLAGYETGVRVGRAMGGTPPGVHDIGTWGQVATAVAVARLLAPADVDASLRALELAASAVLLTDARTVFDGTAGSHAFLGVSVQTGLSLGVAAVAGLGPAPGTLDRHLAAVAAATWSGDELDCSVDDAGWTVHEVLSGYVKAHPTCAHLHGVNDAVADLVQAGVRGSDVREVEVRSTQGTAVFDVVAAGELAARFSVPTSVAVALVTGHLDETTMVDATVRSQEVRDLAARVRVVHDGALDAGYPAGRPARVRAVLWDGSIRVASCDRPRGDGDRAFTRAELSGKASRLLRHRFGTGGAEVLRAVHSLADDAPAREVARAVRGATDDGDPL